MRILLPLMFLLLLVSCGNIEPEVISEEKLEYVTVSAEPRPEPVRINQKDLECLATNIYFEARGEPVDGMIAVAHVTMNRVKSNSFPDDICSVVYQARTHANGVPIKYKCQFSWYCDGKLEVIDEPDKYNEIRDIAKRFLSEQHDDITDGAEFYHSVKVSPFWKTSFEQTVVISDHIFYKKRG